jgi:hypothetical protein
LEFAGAMRGKMMTFRFAATMAPVIIAAPRFFSPA